MPPRSTPVSLDRPAAQCVEAEPPRPWINAILVAWGEEHHAPGRSFGMEGAVPADEPGSVWGWRLSRDIGRAHVAEPARLRRFDQGRGRADATVRARARARHLGGPRSRSHTACSGRRRTKPGRERHRGGPRGRTAGCPGLRHPVPRRSQRALRRPRPSTSANAVGRPAGCCGRRDRPRAPARTNTPEAIDLITVAA